MRQKFAARTFALVIGGIAPNQAAQASLNPQQGLREYSAPFLGNPEVTPEEQGSGDEYMTNEEMQAEYCKDSDPGIQIYFCYMSRISLEEHGHEEFEFLYREFVDTG